MFYCRAPQVNKQNYCQNKVMFVGKKRKTSTQFKSLHNYGGNSCCVYISRICGYSLICWQIQNVCMNNVHASPATFFIFKYTFFVATNWMLTFGMDFFCIGFYFVFVISFHCFVYNRFPVIILNEHTLTHLLQHRAGF